MGKEKTVADRRQHKRFKATTGIFAVNSHFGQIEDISMGGLLFRYVERGPWPEETVETGSLFGEDDLWIDSIPIKFISECMAEDGVACKSTIVKKRSIEFGELTPRQIRLLETFIWVNTKGAVESTHTI